MATIKYSKQRESIKEYLAHTTSHPTADTIYSHIKKTNPTISLGTVYRNLNLLYENGEILKLTCGDGSDHFDGNSSPHYHFICSSCGCVMDLEMESIDHINIIAGAQFAGTIKGHNIIFHGDCPECKSKL